MIVCICHRISDRDIAQAHCQGCASFDDVQGTLRVATRCGRCHESVRAVLDELGVRPTAETQPARIAQVGH